MECNRLEEALRIIYASMTPVAFAALTLYTYQSHPFLSGVFAVLYVMWGWYTIWRTVSTDMREVCDRKLWRYTSWLYALGFIATTSIYVHVGHTLYNLYDHLLRMPPWHLALAILLIVAIATTLFVYVITWAAMSPSDKPSTPNATPAPQQLRIQELHVANAGIVPANSSANQGASGDVCRTLQLHPRYKRLLCRSNVSKIEEVEESYVLAIAAYYHMFHTRNLRVARRLLDALKSRNLDEKEKAALRVLEIAYNAVVDPPCSPQKLLQYMGELENVEAPGWVFLFKVLALMHISGVDQDYKEGVRRGILRAIKSGNCDNKAVCRFVYGIIDYVVPLCPKKQVAPTHLQI